MNSLNTARSTATHLKKATILLGLAGVLALTACSKADKPAEATQNTATVDTSKPLVAQEAANNSLSNSTKPASGEQVASGATSNPDTAMVSQLAKLPNDSKVILQGQLVKDLGNEHYLFKDSTGETPVKIEKELWIGGGFVPDEHVALKVEVENENNKVEVKAEEFRAIVQ
ncbi:MULTISPECIES: NirD/YgiW/YdeI family stress tolerance protein [unclassified Acinetobacter]|uniref:NirD/YgiW/YdeI family stress tolerance protein n=1 Tax=unclassified Acinetobacter TaxID=196816 RepID=UPI0035B7AA51